MRNLTLSIWGINRQKQKRQTKSGVFSDELGTVGCTVNFRSDAIRKP